MASFSLLPLLWRLLPISASSSREGGAGGRVPPLPAVGRPGGPAAHEAPAPPPRAVLEARARLNRRSVPAEIRAAYAEPSAALGRASPAGGATAAQGSYLSACSTSADRTLSESKYSRAMARAASEWRS